MQVPTIVGCIVLAVWDVPDGLKYVAYYLTYTCAGVPGIYYAWYSGLIPHDHEMRGFVIAWSNMFSYIQSIWWTLTVWRTVLAPRFHAAFIAAACLGVALCCVSVLLTILGSATVRNAVWLKKSSVTRRLSQERANPREEAENHLQR